MLSRLTTTPVLVAAALTLGFWLAAAPTAAAQDAAAVKKGQEVYNAQKCSICHAIAGKGGKANPLDGVAAKLSAAEIREWITHPTEAAAKAKSTKKPRSALLSKSTRTSASIRARWSSGVWGRIC